MTNEEYLKLLWDRVQEIETHIRMIRDILARTNEIMKILIEIQERQTKTDGQKTL